LKIFEPRTLPTDSADPPENTAIVATTISGNVVDIAIKVKPTDVLPNLEIVDTFTALVITRLLDQFKAINAMAMISISTTKSVSNISATLSPLIYIAQLAQRNKQFA